MRKTLTSTMTILFIIGLLITIVPTFVLKTEAASSTSSTVISYANAVGRATFSVPSIGNITSMLVAGTHFVQSSLGENFDAISLTLSSPLAKGPVQAFITNNANPDYVSWYKSLQNGTSIYTEANGGVTINNIIQVGSSELTVQRSLTHVTVDFNPANSVFVKLPVDLFPAANFSATWNVPGFHMDFYGTTALAIAPNTTTSYPSGWTFYQDGAGYSANATFSCPSWNSYSVAGSSAVISEFAANRYIPPSPGPVPLNPTKTIDFYTGTGSGAFNITRTGNITRMSVSANHIEQGTLGNPDVLAITLSAAGYSGSVAARLSTNPNPSSFVWLKNLLNGTSSYTEVNGNITINNIFQLSASELVVRRNGTHITIDFSPVIPKAITLPPASFPPTLFPATWVIPAFHMEVDGAGNITTTSTAPIPLSSGWVYSSATVQYSTANATVTIPSWNFSTKPDTSTFVPYTVAVSQWSYALSDWTVVATQGLKAYPGLLETVWQKNASMQPNGPYDKIGLHRLVKTGIIPKGVVFLTNCPTWGMGETRISNPATDTFTKYENFSQAIYWANRGFDVYAIDYRPHFAPQNLNASQMSFAANWGLDVWISDTKEAAEKVKEVSGSDKFFISGECTGGMVALDYATRYWKTDLKGIILLDANFYAQGYPIVGKLRETNTYNLTAVINDMNAKSNWTTSPYAALALSAAYALQNPGAPADYPPGTPLTPTVNPLTNKTWANITEWFTYGLQYNFGSVTSAAPAGMYSNPMGGYGNVSQDEYLFSKTEFLPLRFLVESQAMIDWANCPYLPFDYNDHYNEIGVPVLAFDTIFSNRTGALQFVNGISNTDLTGVYLTNYGHLDLYAGTYSARDVSEPAYRWMLSHVSMLDVSAFQSVRVFPGWTWWFFAQNLGGSAPFTYQWYEGLNPIQGQTSMVLPISKTAPGVYSFYCRVTDKDGTTTTSNAVTLTVIG